MSLLWAFYSVFAALIFAASNIIDKYVISKMVKNPLTPVMISCVMGLVASGLIYFFVGFSSLTFVNILWAFAAGILYIVTIIFYFKAVNIDEISRVVPLFYFSSIFVLILAAIFLTEIFTPIKYLGIFLLVFGAIVISSKDILKIKLGKSFWLMILAALSIAASSIVVKYLLNFADFWTIFGYERLGEVFALIPILYFTFSDVSLSTKKFGVKSIGLMALSETIGLIGLLLVTIGTSIGYVTLVNALTSVQPLFVLLLAVILSIFSPKILKEEIGRSALLQKIIAIIIMFVGLYLIT